MKTIVFFNNKGGVGKTTLACNLVAYLSTEMNKRVLLIDADPQCNATQAMLADDVCEDIYFNADSTIKTLYSYLRPLELGEPTIKKNIIPIIGTANRYHTDLIPGHPSMSIVEDILSDGWASLKAREIRGYRITNWCNHLTESLADRYDYIIFDVGPSLGALNRSIILSCDYIVTPFGCDIFSLLGIMNIHQWILKWKSDYDSSINELILKQPKIITEFNIIKDTNQKFRFAGYSVQQYVTRKFKDGPRPVKSYDAIMKDIPRFVEDSMRKLSKKELDLELGHIPYVYSLIPMAQTAKSPIFLLNNSDGLVGSQYAQVASFKELMKDICHKLIKNIGDL